jgi:hypothetical protein
MTTQAKRALVLVLGFLAVATACWLVLLNQVARDVDSQSSGPPADQSPELSQGIEPKSAGY